MIEITKQPTNKFTFVLKAESGHTLLNSITFSDERIIKDTVSSLNDLITHRKTFERKTNYHGEFLFCIKNSHGEIIGNSQLYQSEAGMENGIKNFKNRIHSITNIDSL
jgi:uncharacterized protein YegP (UPF0339 family)